mgnify:CR=1 FL=1
MEEIIQYFAEVCINRFMKEQEKFFKSPEGFADFEKGIAEAVNGLGREVIRLTLEEINQSFKDSSWRKEKWYVESTDKKQLITTLGTVEYHKTLFTSRSERTEDGKEVMCYLLDKALGFTENQRMSEGACERLYKEAVQTSYRKGGEAISSEEKVSKQAVKELLHKTIFPPNFQIPEQKKEVEYLYIDADEDHYSLQFQNKKGDIERDERGCKKNGAMSKLVYVYEGIEPEAPKSKRNQLINTHYFCRGDGNNKALWEEVYAYIEAHYDMKKIKKIYLNSDGGTWIKAGYKCIAGITYVLDEFHLSKYLLKITGHMLDSQQDARNKLCKVIRKGSKEDFQKEVEGLKGYTESGKAQERIQQAADYILENWGAAKKRLWKKDGVLACSAEGHVYHVLSSRMSTPAMGWSRHGASQMARLREYYYNGGDMLELVKYQKEAVPKAAGEDELELSASAMLRAEAAGRSKYEKEVGKYMDVINHTLSQQGRKKASFNIHKYI